MQTRVRGGGVKEAGVGEEVLHPHGASALKFKASKKAFTEKPTVLL